MSDEVVPKSNYVGNSNKARSEAVAEEPPAKLEKVISGTAIQKPKGLGRRITETFTGDDIQSVGTYILFEVLIPAAKSMLSDAASQGVERMLFGEVRRSPGRARSSYSGGGYTNYNKISSPSGGPRRDDSRTISNKARAAHDFEEITLESRGEAEVVIDNLAQRIEEYDVVSVFDLYELVGITGNFTDQKWGWSDLGGVRIRRDRDGYRLELPSPKHLD